MEPSEWANKAEVIVLGAGSSRTPFNAAKTLPHRQTGVIGLSTALRIQEQGKYKVTIVAETLPSDPKTARYTSHWAVRLRATLKSFLRIVLMTFIREHTTSLSPAMIRGSKVRSFSRITCRLTSKI
jgi:hypothetical protein